MIIKKEATNDVVARRFYTGFSELGGIGSFNKIFTAVLAGKKRVKAEVLRSALHDLCEAGAAHYFERSDTYIIKSCKP